MNKNYTIIAVVLVSIVILGGIYIWLAQDSNIYTPDTTNNPANTVNANNSNTANNQAQNQTKEFKMNAFYDDAGVWFSLKEMAVKKGDTVRVKVTNIKGTHDFTLDEYGIKETTPLNEEVTIEFIADKVGEFVYYCSVPGHRQKGQWGTLKVAE